MNVPFVEVADAGGLLNVALAVRIVPPSPRDLGCGRIEMSTGAAYRLTRDEYAAVAAMLPGRP